MQQDFLHQKRQLRRRLWPNKWPVTRPSNWPCSLGRCPCSVCGNRKGVGGTVGRGVLAGKIVDDLLVM